jgi:hypothetical protein
MADRIDYDLTEAESAVLMATTLEALAAAGALGASLNTLDPAWGSRPTGR